jgi:predicted Fe-S protein YdhL (DUF1289 family)
MSNEVKSPCIAVCRVRGGICIGCFRSSKEIIEWYDADTTRKQEIVNIAQQRKTEFENS